MIQLILSKPTYGIFNIVSPAYLPFLFQSNGGDACLVFSRTITLPGRSYESVLVQFV